MDNKTSSNFNQTLQKALEINLNNYIYGSFAEIGAGQEVARNFFRAGGASGTVAKTMSAYDMTFSDMIYGKEDSGRYVVESRLQKMLNKEFGLLMERLGPVREKHHFFAFADTVTTCIQGKSRFGHGWMGIRFEDPVHGGMSDVIIHVKMLDPRSNLQQEAIGIVGVNLIYSAFFVKNKKEDFVSSLLENVGNDRVEIDAIKVRGPAFGGMDNRVLSLQLVKHNMTKAVLFNECGKIIHPGDTFYKNHRNKTSKN